MAMRDKINRRLRALEEAAAKPAGAPPKPARPLSYNCGHPFSPPEACGKLCPACTGEARKRRAERNRARREQSPKRDPEAGRLPSGSEFSATYDGASQTWDGTLAVPLEASFQTFRGSASGVFKLLIALDGQYREWLKSGEVKP